MSKENASLVMVEDSPTQAARLKFQLEGQGYTVRVANRGEAAIELCKEEAPDLLITDVTMPGMDGYDVCRAVKKDGKLKGVPVMLLTGLSDPQDIIWGLEAGADCYLTKPYTDEELFNRIEFVLANVSPEELMQGSEVDPIEVSFLGQSHTIKSTRKQMLNLLLSTYESAARRNEVLDKSQLKMKIELKETKRRAEMAEASLTVAQAQVEDSEGSWKELVESLPTPVLVYDNGELVCASSVSGSLKAECKSYADLKASGKAFQESDVELMGVDLRFVTMGGGAAHPIDASLARNLKRGFVEKVSATIHRHLSEANEAAQKGGEESLSAVKSALAKLGSVDLLEWEALAFHIDKRELSLQEVVSSVLDSYTLQSMAAGREQTLEPGHLPAANVVGDRFRIEEALREVVENAVLYGPPKSKIYIGLKELGSDWELSVTDEGSGPPEEIAEVAAEAFVSGQEGGLGLGLAYARKVCRSHGGDLTCSVTDGRFTVKMKIVSG